MMLPLGKGRVVWLLVRLVERVKLTERKESIIKFRFHGLEAIL